MIKKTGTVPSPGLHITQAKDCKIILTCRVKRSLKCQLNGFCSGRHTNCLISLSGYLIGIYIENILAADFTKNLDPDLKSKFLTNGDGHEAS